MITAAQVRTARDRSVTWAKVMARSRTRTPFPDLRDAPTLLHCPHHKVGTVWFENVMRAVAAEFGLRVHRVTGPGVLPRADVLLYRSARLFDPAALAARRLRGSHMVRDPRDVVVSGYYYHLWTPEKWVHRPRADLGGASYQEYLRSLPQDEGLAAEIRRAAGTSLSEMSNWDYERPEFLELRYEQILGNELETFGRVFHHYGFTEASAARAAELADTFSFRQMTGRSVGEAQLGTHYRSGRPGEWREAFTNEHRKLFKEMTGDLVERLGYETGPGW